MRKVLIIGAGGIGSFLIPLLDKVGMYDMLLAGKDGSFSCQGDSWDGSNKGVHFMQVAIAGLGAQWIQRWFNGEDVQDYMVVNA